MELDTEETSVWHLDDLPTGDADARVVSDAIDESLRVRSVLIVHRSFSDREPMSI